MLGISTKAAKVIEMLSHKWLKISKKQKIFKLFGAINCLF